MITIEKLKQFPANSVFASGESLDTDHVGEPFRWVAIRGTFYDWAIYYLSNEMSFGYIQHYGDKIKNIEVVKRLVHADEEALNMYRS